MSKFKPLITVSIWIILLLPTKLAIAQQNEKVHNILKKEYNADFICYDNIVIETKALCDLTSEHESQLLNYLKATEKKLGILINFGKPQLQHKRILNNLI